MEKAVRAEVIFTAKDFHDNEAQQDPNDTDNSSHDRLWNFVATPHAERHRF